jgi:hypothetical protein
MHRRDLRFRYYFEEHDNPRDPLASVRSSLHYLNGLS